MKFLEVEWMDIVVGSEWDKRNELPKPHKCTSRGWLVLEEVDFIVLSATLGKHQDPKEEDEYNQTVAIPRGCIIITKEIDG